MSLVVHMVRCSLVVLCLAALNATAVADGGKIGSASMSKLQNIVNEAAIASGAVGAQVSVILGDERADFVYGSANTELNLPMTADTIVQIGSVTKVLNAALIMTLVDDGMLALDVPVVRYIPDLTLADEKARNEITLRQLLSMSSGVDNGPYAEHGRGEDALARYIAAVRDIPQNFPAGKGFGYSNAGTCIAGYAAERVTGKSWDALLRQRIIEPTEMTHAETLAENLPYQRVSVGHTRMEKGKPAAIVRPWYVNRAQGPAGSTLTMSAHDLASFGQLFVNGGKTPKGTRVLSEGAVKAMLTPLVHVPMPVPEWGVGDRWGIGPNMSKWGDTVVWGHAGGNRSGMSHLLWIPEKRAVLAFTVNVGSALEPFSAYMFGAFSQAVFGVRGPKAIDADGSVPLENSQRFVGTYERYQARFEISERSGGLHYKEFRVMLGAPAELGLEGELIPLGSDRFLLKTADNTKGLPRGFFGTDAQGRAENLLDPVHAARRVK